MSRLKLADICITFNEAKSCTEVGHHQEA